MSLRFASGSDAVEEAAAEAGRNRPGGGLPGPAAGLPDWLPGAVRLYLDHTEKGISLRALARREGCHASTVMRQVRRFENRRDDPLVDEAIARLGRRETATVSETSEKETTDMSAPIRLSQQPADDASILREAPHILRLLSEPGTVLAIAADMDKAVVLRAGRDGQMAQMAALDRQVAQAFALKDWISCQKAGRISTYVLSVPGRMALKRMGERSEVRARGFAEDAAPFAGQHRDWDEREGDEGGRRLRYNAGESPVSVLARRRDKEGRAFLEPALVAAAERLREDFELAQMGPRVTQNWERFLTAGDKGGFRDDGGRVEGPGDARDRVALALRDLGPGLGDVALRCCCFLEGLETAEQRMGWAARSGKIVLRIALQRLRRHYDEIYGRSGPLIG